MSGHSITHAASLMPQGGEGNKNVSRVELSGVCECVRECGREF